MTVYFPVNVERYKNSGVIVMRALCFGMTVLLGFAAVGCGKVDNTVVKPKNVDPMPAGGPTGMAGPEAPPPVSPPPP